MKTTSETIHGAINTLEAILKTDHTNNELHEHIGLQLQLMKALNLERSAGLFNHIENAASFNELWAATHLIGDYGEWLFSPWEPKFVLELLGKIKPTQFRTLEVAALTHRATHIDSITWWFNTSDAILHFQVGNLADALLSRTAGLKAPGEDRIVYNFGEFKRLMWMTYCGFSHPDPERDGTDFVNLLEKEKRRKSIHNFDDFKAVETVRNWKKKEALRFLCNGFLFKNTFKRSHDRTKDDFKKQRTASRGGCTPKEIGQRIMDLCIDRDMSIPELAKKSGKSEEFVTDLVLGDIKSIYPRTILPITNVLEVCTDDIMNRVKESNLERAESRETDPVSHHPGTKDPWKAPQEEAVISKEYKGELLNLLRQKRNTPLEYRILLRLFFAMYDGIKISPPKIATLEGKSANTIRKILKQLENQVKAIFY